VTAHLQRSAAFIQSNFSGDIEYRRLFLNSRVALIALAGDHNRSTKSSGGPISYSSSGSHTISASAYAGISRPAGTGGIQRTRQTTVDTFRTAVGINFYF
jgi:hypothetical protein